MVSSGIVHTGATAASSQLFTALCLFPSPSPCSTVSSSTATVAENNGVNSILVGVNNERGATATINSRVANDLPNLVAGLRVQSAGYCVGHFMKFWIGNGAEQYRTGRGIRVILVNSVTLAVRKLAAAAVALWRPAIFSPHQSLGRQALRAPHIFLSPVPVSPRLILTPPSLHHPSSSAPDLHVQYSERTFDTFAAVDQSYQLRDLLNAQSDGTIALMAAYDEATRSLEDGARNAIRNYGSEHIFNVVYRGEMLRQRWRWRRLPPFVSCPRDSRSACSDPSMCAWLLSSS